MTLYYESSDGTIIDFMSNGIYAQEPETLLENDWQYTTISGINGIAKIKRFYKDVKAYNLTLDIMADTEEEFNALMYKMHAAFDKDVQSLIPARLWWNDFYKEIYVVASSHTEFDELFESVTKKLTILSLRPMWTREYKYQYMISASEIGALDYGMEGFYDGFDYDGFDYGQAENIDILNVDVISAANFELVFYGPIQKPTVTIGKHKYGLNVDLAAGEYATVNSLKKKIKKYDRYGHEENIYHTRNRDSEIFEKLPAGTLQVLKSSELAFDITIYDERGEPVWI